MMTKIDNIEQEQACLPAGNVEFGSRRECWNQCKSLFHRHGALAFCALNAYAPKALYAVGTIMGSTFGAFFQSLLFFYRQVAPLGHMYSPGFF
jgi:hypothetical protein